MWFVYVGFRWKVEMPSLVKESIKIISDAGLGMAMFSLGNTINTLWFCCLIMTFYMKRKEQNGVGLFMGLQPKMIACGGKRAVLGMGIRFVFGPIAMSAASLAVGLRGVHLHAAIVQVISTFFNFFKTS